MVALFHFKKMQVCFIKVFKKARETLLIFTRDKLIDLNYL